MDVRLLVLTGMSGSGKSHLIARLLRTLKEDMWVLDPLQCQLGRFLPPPRTPRLVALDHAEFVDQAPIYCDHLLSWADQAGVPVLLAAFSVAALRATGIQLAEPVTEIEMLGRGGDTGVNVTLNGCQRQLDVDDFAETLAEFEAGVVIARASHPAKDG